MAEITVGAQLPAAKLLQVGASGPEAVELGEKLKGRKVVIFGLPGAYTGTCSNAHVPSFIRTAGAFREKGVAEIICVSVNDPFVMAAWADSTGAKAAGLTFLADADGGFTKAIGLAFDVPPAGLFGRSKRYALLAEDGVVKVLHLEASPGQCDISGGEALLAEV
ncbi:peroxiredoxin [Pseudogemmobacter humi]|uniref:Glutathione-dependent peroxiredoxin n=1 Tax=Pseudogemmobacter humi TaxID=2483812 RepID=A0A3P5WZ34_9RHOB|nr:peroxiredoxin [Pseudogemmobacter humi]VDC21257.1 Glutathione amide-dependent peroxidase [Pseudogemmobacter humi]